MKKYLFLLFAFVLIGFGVYAGYLLFAPRKSAVSVDSQSIVSMLKREGFLVTQTYIVNQQVGINNRTGQVFRDFFWGQDIVAFGNMKVSTGVDLNKLTDQDIRIEGDNVSVALPQVSVHSTELLGDITLQNKQGILKRIFDYDSGYNTAYQTLRSQAIAGATTTTLMMEAEENTRKEVERIIKLAIPNRDITINFKP